MRSDERASSSIRSQRTQPALPGATASTFPLNTRRSSASASKRGYDGYGGYSGYGRVMLPLLALGVLLEITYVALYPLLAHIINTGSDASKQQMQQVQDALPGLFPWLPHLYWTNVFPSRLLAAIPVLNLLDSHNPNLAATLLSTFLLLFAALLVLLAFGVGNRALRDSSAPVAPPFLVMFLLAILFSITMLFSPISLNTFSQEMLASGLYGRMIAIHHVNPYSVAPTAFSQDFLQSVLHLTATTHFGSVWLDTSFGVTLLAGESIANILLDFRVLALLAHLANAVLLWSILARLKPQVRLSLSLLYAWNPLILLFGIAYVHQEIVLITVVLLAIFFFQRNSPTIGWIFVLLTALINLLWLPLVLLFFRYMLHESRILRANQRLLWWLGMALTSVIVIVLAYAPYWHGLGSGGFATQLHDAFLPDTAMNSIDASLLNLPIAAHVSWLLAPHSWSLFVLGLMSLFLILGLLLADTLELIVLFSCWLLLILVFLSPTYWPWYTLGPVALALCSTHRRTLLLAIMLMIGTLLSFCFLLMSSWKGQALVTIGLPIIIWGWVLFFSVTWQMVGERTQHERRLDRTQRFQGTQSGRSSGLSRPSWSGRASRPPRSRS